MVRARRAHSPAEETARAPQTPSLEEKGEEERPWMRGSVFLALFVSGRLFVNLLPLGEGWSALTDPAKAP